MRKMKPWAKRLWIKALEGTEYMYAPNLGHMRRMEDGKLLFDALGILCEAMPRCFYQPARNETEEDRYYYKNNHSADHGYVRGSYIPDNLAEEMHLSNLAQYKLAIMSDDGASKKEIVDWIRRNL